MVNRWAAMARLLGPKTIIITGVPQGHWSVPKKVIQEQTGHLHYNNSFTIRSASHLITVSIYYLPVRRIGPYDETSWSTGTVLYWYGIFFLSSCAIHINYEFSCTLVWILNNPPISLVKTVWFCYYDKKAIGEK